mmetsp:Transcript_48373/g.149284  ORF Transcript_48373/g.149284 Transcript_48373/m.149284 type:complete len:279 (+) Transcript_48373:2391-3227(+)
MRGGRRVAPALQHLRVDMLPDRGTQRGLVGEREADRLLQRRDPRARASLPAASSRSAYCVMQRHRDAPHACAFSRGYGRHVTRRVVRICVGVSAAGFDRYGRSGLDVLPRDARRTRRARSTSQRHERDSRPVVTEWRFLRLRWGSSREERRCALPYRRPRHSMALQAALPRWYVAAVAGTIPLRAGPRAPSLCRRRRLRCARGRAARGRPARNTLVPSRNAPLADRAGLVGRRCHRHSLPVRTNRQRGAVESSCVRDRSGCPCVRAASALLPAAAVPR